MTPSAMSFERVGWPPGRDVPVNYNDIYYCLGG